MESEIKNFDNFGDSEMVQAFEVTVQQQNQVMISRISEDIKSLVNFPMVHQLGVQTVHPRTSLITSENTNSSNTLFNTQTGQISEPDVLHAHRVPPLIIPENINSSYSLFNSQIRPDVFIQPRLDLANERVRKNVAARFKEKNAVAYNHLLFKPAAKKLGSDVKYIPARSHKEVTMSARHYLGLMLSRVKSKKEKIAHFSRSIIKRIQEIEKQYGTEISTPCKQRLELLHSETKVAEKSLAFLTRVLRFEKLPGTEIPTPYKRCLILQYSKAKIHAEKIALQSAGMKKLFLRLLAMDMRTASEQYFKLLSSKIKDHACQMALMTIDIKKQIKILEVFQAAKAKMTSPFKQFLGLVHSKAKSHEKKITFLARSVKKLTMLVKLKEAEYKKWQGNIPDDLLENFKAIHI
ncbi:uncharacterized protein LOC118180025 [Stegodyphus dumicola]|uniref:uncharacterized protein LOC118180025 n=1 Tax=Stegodyphus dumicola TaxID=202533 RepID=UPI0015B37BBD|nr:uncharacterized protein LOC118180025 [Stegodyphus dumicola]